MEHGQLERLEDLERQVTDLRAQIQQIREISRAGDKRRELEKRLRQATKERRELKREIAKL